MPAVREAEKALITLCLLKNDYFGVVQIFLSHEDFTDAGLSYIFRIMKAHHDHEKQWSWELMIDTLTMLDDRPKELQYPSSYIAELLQNPPSEGNFKLYLNAVIGHKKRAEGLDYLKHLELTIQNPSVTFVDIQQEIYKLDDIFREAYGAKVRDITSTNVTKELDSDIAEMLAIQRINTGYPSLDAELTWGLFSKGVTVLGARTSMGKSVFCSNVQYNLSEANIFNIKIPIEQKIMAELFRHIAIRTGMSMRKIARVHDWEKLSEQDYRTIQDAKKYFETGKDGNGWPFRLVKPTGYYTLKDIKRVVVDSINKGQHPRVVFVDLFSQISEISTASQQEQAAIIRHKVDEAAIYAEELNVHFFLVAQLKRMGKDRDKLDMREMFKGSGAWEERGDLVLQLERPHYYDKDVEDNTLLVKILKQRDGPTPVIELGWNKENLRIYEKASKDYTDDVGSEYEETGLFPFQHGLGEKKEKQE